MEITTIIKTTATGLAAISCLGLWALSACLGPLAAVAWHRMPDSWLCDYHECKTRTCGERGFALFPWAFFFSAGFLACGAWLCRSSDSLHCTVALLLLWILLLIFLADTKFQVIPDQLWVALLPMGLLWDLSEGCKGDWPELLPVLTLRLASKTLAGLFCGGVFWFFGRLSAAWVCRADKEAGLPEGEIEMPVGFGDIKLLFALGFVLGLEGGLIALLCASLLGGFCFGTMVLLGRAGLSDERPFGPYLCLAAAAQVLLP